MPERPHNHPPTDSLTALGEGTASDVPIRWRPSSCTSKGDHVKGGGRRERECAPLAHPPR